MADIFISYAREDRDTAKRLAGALEASGWSVWWDTRLKAGEIWDEMIERELKATRSVVVLWSAESVKSRWVRKEARYGDENRMLFPAMIEPVDIPFEFSDVHAEDLRDWTDDPSHLGLRDLVDALALLLGEPLPAQPKRPAQAKKQTKTPRQSSPKKPSAPEHRADLSVFRDVDEPWCPEMVVLPAGDFMMGSPDTDKDASDNEKPRHKVTIGYRLAVGRYPLTFEEYDRYCEATGFFNRFFKKPGDQDWGRGRRPVINVSWDDAKGYAEWLGKETGKTYRLLSESEWEYACRAGTDTWYSCGDTIAEQDANFGRNATTEVGSYPANPWGLYDMHGNVWEWVEDHWHENYKGAPDDGGAWTKGGDQTRRAVRGGAWLDCSRNLRSARRFWLNSVFRGRLGFRVARTV